jgi:MoxR-like ATPase
VLEQATQDAVEPPAPEDETVEIGFWNLTQHGPRRRSRQIEAPPWAEIRGNYTGAAAAAMDTLVAITPPALPGRLLLFYGPPGTGKTTALRALAREWRGWCQLDFVLDPERLFAEPGYLTEVVVGRDDDDERTWRLLLLEDCDELIRTDAKQSTGQALSRLLNLTDGILGQGRQVLVAITTNEDIGRLHPAVTRPGRCLARIEVGAMRADEATAWLERAGLESTPGIEGAGATLAELFARRVGAGPVVTAEAPPTWGQYL